MLATSENNYISDKNPNKYLPELIENLGTNYKEVFKSNLFSILSKEEHKAISYDDFIETRVKIISDKIVQLCNGEV